jgi:hypothetical protein
MNSSVEIKFSIRLFFYLFILLLPFDNEFALFGVSVVTYIGFLLMASVLTNRTFFFKSHFTFILLLVPFSIGTFVDFIELNNGSQLGFNELIHPLMLLVLILITYSIAIRGKLITIIWLIYGSTIILLLYQLFSSNDMNNLRSGSNANDETRMTTLGSDPNFVASYLSLGMIMSIYLLLKAIVVPKKIWYLSVLLIPLFMFGIINTGSRGGLIALVFGLISIIFTKKGVKTQLLYIVFIAVVFGFGAYFILHDASFLYRLQMAVDDGDTAGRDYIWQKAWGLTSDSPLFGLGYYGYMARLGPLTGGSMLKVTHNTYLAMILATGWIGTILFLLFNYYVLKSVWKYRTYPFGNFLFSAFIVCTISAQSVNLEISKWFWIILALSISLKKNSSLLLNEKIRL